jgi:hypothetical protein
VQSFHDTIVPDTYEVLGIRLRPFSLGHYILLEKNACALLLGGPVTVIDFAAAVVICSSTFEEFLEAQASGAITKHTKRLAKVCQEIDLEKETQFLREYLEEGVQGPSYWFKDKGKNLETPLAQVIRVQLHSKTNLTESEIMNRPFAMNLWDIVTLGEMDGSLNLKTEADDEAKKKADEFGERFAKMEAEREANQIRNN